MSSQFLQENLVGNGIKDFTKVQVNNFYNISLVHLVGNLVTGDQVSQEECIVHKDILTGPDHLAVMYVPCDCAHDDLLHNLPWCQDQTNRPAVLWMLLLALLTDASFLHWTPKFTAVF